MRDGVVVELDRWHLWKEVTQPGEQFNKPRNRETYPHRAVFVKTFASLCHLERQLDDGIRQFFALCPLHADNGVETDEREPQHGDKAGPDENRDSPPAQMLGEMERGISLKIGI